MGQLVVDDRIKEGQAGQLADSGFTDKISEVIDNPTVVAQVSTVTVGGATNATLYEVLVNGIVSQYTSDGSATVTEIVAGLVAAMQANGFLDALVTVVDADPDITITAKVAGTALTVTETDGATGDLSIAATTANVLAGKNIPFGKAVVRGSGFEKVKLPDAASQTFRGISIFSGSIGNPKVDATGTGQTTGEPVYKPTDQCALLRRGRIIVAYEGAAPGVSDAVYFRQTISDATTQTLGALTVVNDAETDPVPNAEWVSLLPQAGLAVIEISNP